MTLDLKDRLYTSSEVAEILGVSLRSVYRYLEEGKLDADIKTATGRHRFSKRNILDFLQPGGITKEQAENQFSTNNQNTDEDFDVLDLPALNKTKKSEESYDDFSFDLDDDFFKSLNFDSPVNNKEPLEIRDSTPNNSKQSNLNNGEFIDDDLEKLLREFEDKEMLDETENTSSKNIGNSNSVKSSEFVTDKEDDFDFDLDDFFKELEKDSSNNDLQNSKTSSTLNNNPKNNNNDDFDFDLDFFENDFKLDTDLNLKNNFNSQSYNSNSKEILSKVEEEDSEEEDNWLERFRKAATKNSTQTPSSNFDDDKKDNLKDSFFESTDIDHFFGGLASKSSTISESVSSIGSSNFNQSKTENLQKKRELYYTSSLNGLKEIAQNIDKIAKKFDTDYAFTLNAGLSLHKPISPFTLIHVYVKSRDLELFEDYLNLTPVDKSSEASVCLMIPDDISIFEDSYELHGLYVVSNVQLRSDLIDKGLDKLAREI